MWSPARGTQSRLCCRGGSLLPTPPVPGPTQSPRSPPGQRQWSRRKWRRLLNETGPSSSKMARWRQKAARMRTPSPGTERRENPTKRWRWASDRGRDKWGSRRARQTGNPSKPGHCPETLLLLLLLSPRKGESRSEDPAQARPAATRLQALLRALLAAILALGSHLTAGGPSQHPRNATTAGPGTLSSAPGQKAETLEIWTRAQRQKSQSCGRGSCGQSPTILLRRHPLHPPGQCQVEWAGRAEARAHSTWLRPPRAIPRPRALKQFTK